MSFSNDAGSPLDYLAVNILDAEPLGAAPNIYSFNSANRFGRRQMLAMAGRDVMDLDNESLISHAFFKENNNNDYFPDILENSNLTVRVLNITYAEPVSIDPSTIMVHQFWVADQVDGLVPLPYDELHNHNTLTDPFRESDEFYAGGVFSTTPENTVFGDNTIDVEISGNGTTTIDIEVTFPYTMLRHLEQTNQVPDVGVELPDPHGFLEPFHFHIEYVVRFDHCAGGASSGDTDNNGSLELADHADLADCLLGPLGKLGNGCHCFDFDEDEDVDLRNFASFQRNLDQP